MLGRISRLLPRQFSGYSFILPLLLAIIGAGCAATPTDAVALTPKHVVISEVAWMGTTAATSDEWIELYNNTTGDIDLSGWNLRSGDGTPNINLSGTIPVKGYFLLERTDDTTVPDHPADLIYTGALGNSGEALSLSDNTGTIQDQTNSVWDAGNNTSKATMSRVDVLAEGTDPANWAMEA